jgi:mRNA-degrading endonuclease RelE of RelBE toxin-antitoxin system
MAENRERPWRIKTLPPGQADLDELPDHIRAEALTAIQDLGADPFPLDCIALRGHRSLYRTKFYGNRYRLIYEVSPQQRTVKILRARPRSNAYHGL